MFALVVLYAIIIMMGAGLAATVMNIGKPRGPITPGTATLVLFVSLLQAAGLTYVATQLV